MKDVLKGLIIIIACFSSIQLYLTTQEMHDLKQELAKDELVIQLQDSLIRIKNDSLDLADEAIEDFKEYQKIQMAFKLDSAKTKWKQKTDEEIRRIIFANRNN